MTEEAAPETVDTSPEPPAAPPVALMPDGRPEVVEQPNTLPVRCARCGLWVKQAGHAISRGVWDDSPERAKPRREWTQRCADAAACKARIEAASDRRRKRLEGINVVRH